MPKIFNIYNFGSCRTNYIFYENNGHYNISKRLFFHHSPFEILQILDFFENKKNYNDALFPKAFNKFNLSEEKKNFINADIILIEICSLKHVFDNNNICYNIVELNDEYYLDNGGDSWTWMDRELNNYNISNIDELVELLVEIKKRINKPIIFQGHINLPFLKNNLGESTWLKSRQIIDNAIKKVTNNYIIYEDILSKFNIAKICQISNSLCHGNLKTSKARGKIFIINKKIIICNSLCNRNIDINMLKITYFKENEYKIINNIIKGTNKNINELDPPIYFESTRLFTNNELKDLSETDIIYLIEPKNYKKNITVNDVDSDHITTYANSYLFNTFDKIVKKLN